MKNKEEALTDFLRHRERFRAWLLGKEYYKAVEALEYAARYHNGLRKNGITPEFEHQLSIVHYLRTLPNLRNQQTTLIAGLLHDLAEDYNVSFKEIETRFGIEVSETVWILTKKYDNKKKSNEDYYTALSQHPFASLVKGADRIHNHQTLQTFDCCKQILYIQETQAFVLPMLREARNNFPDQELAYENIKHALKGQIELLELSIQARQQLEELKINKPGSNNVNSI